MNIADINESVAYFDMEWRGCVIVTPANEKGIHQVIRFGSCGNSQCISTVIGLSHAKAVARRLVSTAK